MAWRLARSLERLRAQINALAPGRSKASDGTIGDAAHASRKSDHNPDADGVVRAMDITHDPASGCDCNAIAASLVASRDPRIQYIIWNRRIVNREVSPWVWRPYPGSNPHDKHIHISVDEKPALYDDARDWAVRVTAGVAPPPAGVEVFAQGVRSDRVAAVQERLVEIGFPEVGKVDGLYGSRTRAALNVFRRAHGLPEQAGFVLTPADVAALFRQPDDPGAPDLSQKRGCRNVIRNFIDSIRRRRG